MGKMLQLVSSDNPLVIVDNDAAVRDGLSLLLKMEGYSIWIYRPVPVAPSRDSLPTCGLRRRFSSSPAGRMPQWLWKP